MAFNLKNWIPVSAQANSNGPRIYTYETTDDIATVEASGYFNSKIYEVQEGDFLIAQCSDGSIFNQFSISGNDVLAGTRAGQLYTGWGNYQDTQYTSGSPFSLSANSDTVLPNNKGSVLEAQLPVDVSTFYDGSVITGRNGDGIMITVDLLALPTSAGTTYIEFWFDIGGAVGELYRRIISFPKGNGVERPINFTVAGYTLDTWEANGATVYARANGTCNLYNIRYLITRTHKAL